jgi:hypothetical protein
MSSNSTSTSAGEIAATTYEDHIQSPVSAGELMGHHRGFSLSVGI